MKYCLVMEITAFWDMAPCSLVSEDLCPSDVSGTTNPMLRTWNSDRKFRPCFETRSELTY
jgi:hypothetical protein